jgi:hypothetical protein
MHPTSLLARLFALVLLALSIPPLQTPAAHSSPQPTSSAAHNTAINSSQFASPETHTVRLAAASAETPGIRRWLSHSAAEPARDLWLTVRARTLVLPQLTVVWAGDNAVYVSGRFDQLTDLLKQLERYPVLGDVSWVAPEDVPANSTKALRGSAPAHFVYLRMPWAANVIWGSSAPQSVVSATVQRDGRDLYSIQQRSDDLTKRRSGNGDGWGSAR